VLSPTVLMHLSGFILSANLIMECFIPSFKSFIKMLKSTELSLGSGRSFIQYIISFSQ